jgi:hypothetical protein
MELWLLPITILTVCLYVACLAACLLAGAFDMNPQNNAVKLPYILIVSELACLGTAAAAVPVTHQPSLQLRALRHMLCQLFTVAISEV